MATRDEIKQAMINRVVQEGLVDPTTNQPMPAMDSVLDAVADGIALQESGPGFGKVKVGPDTLEAETSGDTLELVAGDNIALTPDTVNDRVTVAVTPIGASGLQDGAATDAKVGDRTVDQEQAPAGNTGTLTQLFSWIVNRIKAITGATNWFDGPAATLASIWAKFHGSTGHKHTGAADDGPQIDYASIAGRPSSFDPAPHKATHSSGGSDALSPGDIGAATTAHTHPSLTAANCDLILGSATWGRSNGEANVLGAIKAGAISGNSRLMIYSDAGITNVYVDGTIYVSEGNHQVWHAGNLTPAAIGAATQSHTHTNLPLTNIRPSGTGRVVVQNDYGSLTIAPANTGWCHFNTDRPKFWFDRDVAVAGEIWAGPSYNQKVVTLNNIIVVTGTVTDGGTVPTPSGWDRANCKVFVSLRDGRARDTSMNWDDPCVQCWVDPSTWVVKADVFDTDGRVYTASANYLIIGVR